MPECPSCGFEADTLSDYEISPKVVVPLCSRCIQRTEHNYREAQESEEHKQLKELAKEKLRDMGFDEGKIFEEYKITDDYGGWKWIDVAGIGNERKIAVECNYSQQAEPSQIMAKEQGFEVMKITKEDLNQQDKEVKE